MPVILLAAALESKRGGAEEELEQSLLRICQQLYAWGQEELI